MDHLEEQLWFGLVEVLLVEEVLFVGEDLLGHCSQGTMERKF